MVKTASMNDLTFENNDKMEESTKNTTKNVAYNKCTSYNTLPGISPISKLVDEKASIN